MNKKQLLNYLKNDVYCRIGVSKIHGVGVIAIRDIPKGIDPFKKSFNEEGELIQYNELEGLDNGVRGVIDDFLVHEKNAVMIPWCGLNRLDISFYLNHSDKPNMTTTDDGETFITNRIIKRGEELTYPYNEFDRRILKKQRK